MYFYDFFLIIFLPKFLSVFVPIKNTKIIKFKIPLTTIQQAITIQITVATMLITNWLFTQIFFSTNPTNY